MKTLRFILGDQLSHQISSLKNCNQKQDIILMCEVLQEATYVKHHKKKIAFLFSAMRHFAKELQDKGYKVNYIKLNDKNNSGSFTGELKRAIQKHKIQKVVITFPGEYRVLQNIKKWSKDFDIEVEIKPDDRFLSTPDEFKDWVKGRKELRMEYFYREMRKKHKILMDGDQPIGQKWNYDKENRKPLKKDLNIPQTYQAQIDNITQDVLDLVQKEFSDHFGDLEPFYFAVTREQALYALKKFINERLKYFGDYQDAMLQHDAFLYHSHISFYLNCGLLNPKECIELAEKSYRNKTAPLNAVEGFIRQILGWREYVRGMYWYQMPQYKKKNFFDAKRNLPDFFWNANTNLNCLKTCIQDTKENAYAHHIQRLMVLGNFTLLSGIDPQQVQDWYLLVYADAYEWVEMPNVVGMILYADGGELASKPYAAGGAYINKMSDYCKNCVYDVKEKTGEKACPFNYLYWNFLITHQKKLSQNPRLGMIYKTFVKMDDKKIKNIKDSANQFFKNLR